MKLSQLDRIEYGTIHNSLTFWLGFGLTNAVLIFIVGIIVSNIALLLAVGGIIPTANKIMLISRTCEYIGGIEGLFWFVWFIWRKTKLNKKFKERKLKNEGENTLVQ